MMCVHRRVLRSCFIMLVLVGCGSQVGDPCSLDSDCGQGLVCDAQGACATVNAVRSQLGPWHFDFAYSNAERLGASSESDTAFDGGDSGTGVDGVDVASATDGADTADTADETDSTDGTVGVDGIDGTDSVDGTLQTTHVCGASEPWIQVPSECTTPAGRFEPQDSCPEPTAVYKVVSMTMEKYGGLVKLADLANPIITDSIEKGMLILMSVDGSFSQSCDFDFVWSTDASDFQDDCSTKYGVNMPVPIPGILEGPAILRQINYDWASGTFEGIVNKAELIAQVPESLQPTSSGLIDADLDLDGDGVNESVSSKFTVCLAPL